MDGEYQSAPNIVTAAVAAATVTIMMVSGYGQVSAKARRKKTNEKLSNVPSAYNSVTKVYFNVFSPFSIKHVKYRRPYFDIPYYILVYDHKTWLQQASYYHFVYVSVCSKYLTKY